MPRKPFFLLPLLRTLSIVALASTLIPSCGAQAKYKVLYNFKGPPDADGPFAGVTFDQNGDLYGTTVGGGTGECGTGGCGTVYKLTHHPNGKWTERVMHSFQSWGDFPFAGLVADTGGNLYGSTTNTNLGLFELTVSGGWKQFGLPDGGSAWTLLMDNAGSLFGALGDVYEIDREAGGWKQYYIYVFDPHSGKDGTDGSAPVGTLISDSAGNLHGATQLGGNYSLCAGSGGCGTVFELIRTKDGKWKEHVLHRFAQFNNDGQLPFAGVVMDGKGSLYGTTIEGGNFRNNNICLVGCGTVFELVRDSRGHWKETILHNFTNGTDGSAPEAPVVVDQAGNVYGTAAGGGGACGCGVVFKLTPGTNGKWTFTVLHQFDSKDGYTPLAGLVLQGGGNLYGTTAFGGAYGYGVVFQITP